MLQRLTPTSEPNLSGFGKDTIVLLGRIVLIFVDHVGNLSVVFLVQLVGLFQTSVNHTCRLDVP